MTREVSKTVVDRVAVPLDASAVRVDLALDQRRKGLLWYATYGVTFAGTYRLGTDCDVNYLVRCVREA